MTTKKTKANLSETWTTLEIGYTDNSSWTEWTLQYTPKKRRGTGSIHVYKEMDLDVRKDRVLYLTAPYDYSRDGKIHDAEEIGEISRKAWKKFSELILVYERLRKDGEFSQS